MNNATIAIDEEKEVDVETSLGKQQAELVKIIEAIRTVASSKEWVVLKELVFDGVVINLERQLKSEAQKDEVNAPQIYRLQGQLVWARKFADLSKLAEFFKTQLEGITLKIKHEQRNSADGAA